MKKVKPKKVENRLLRQDVAVLRGALKAHLDEIEGPWRWLHEQIVAWSNKERSDSEFLENVTRYLAMVSAATFHAGLLHQTRLLCDAEYARHHGERLVP